MDENDKSELGILRKRVILQRRELRRLNKQTIVLSERAKQRVREETYRQAARTVSFFILASSAAKYLKRIAAR